MSDLDTEWLEALEVEAPADDPPADDEPVDDKPTDEEEKPDDVTDSNDSDSASDDSADDGRAPAEEEAPQAEVKYKEAVKEALQEIESTKAEKASHVDSLKKEVIETLYPDGIDRQLRDSDGDPITSIDDLTKLIKPGTVTEDEPQGRFFTEEEAGAWLLASQQKLNKDIEAVENFVEKVAEVNAIITDGAQRVALKYKDVLNADEALRKRLVDAYDKTLVKDPKTGITLNAPVDIEEFFDLALEARLIDKVEQAKVEQTNAKRAQADRGDLKPSGKSDTLDPSDKEWAEAYKAYEEGA